MVEKLSKDDIEAMRTRGLDDFYFFAKGILGFDRLCTSIHYPLAKKLENLQKTRRLKITLPRGWYKTTVASCAYPIWRALKNPNERILLAQNTYANACKKLKRIKGAFEQNDLFRRLFYDFLPPSNATWKSDALCIKRHKAFDEATFEAAGTGTQVTGRHYTIIIEDDTVSPELEDMQVEFVTPSLDDIGQAIGWHRAATPLMDDAGTSQRLVVGTRWAIDDLLSWIDENEGYDSYMRAALEDENGEPDIKGNPTYPERFGRNVLREIEASLGSYMFSCLYLNVPVPSSLMVFRKEWLQFFDILPPQGRLMVYITVDPAGDPQGARGEPDYNVILVGGKDMATGYCYVLDYWRSQANPGEVIEALFDLVETYHPLQIGIESNAYQNTFAYWVKEWMRKTGTFFPIKPQSSLRKKEDRIKGLQPLVESGTLLFKKWMKELFTEMEAFPKGANDDILDALSMQLRFWKATAVEGKSKEKEDKSNPLLAGNVMDETRFVRNKGRGDTILSPKDIANWAKASVN